MEHTHPYLSNRVFKLNVGFLLTAGPGYHHDSVFDFPAVRLSADLIFYYTRGPLRLSRTKEGILVQGQLTVGVTDECFRCLEPIEREINITVEELYAYPPSPTSEFSVGDDGILDLAPLLRDEVLIATSRGVLCRPDCRGLCPGCGVNLNHKQCTCKVEDIDPRLAPLQQLLDSRR